MDQSVLDETDVSLEQRCESMPRRFCMRRKCFSFPTADIMWKSERSSCQESIGCWSFSLGRYHSWMQNEEMQELTASLPLTIEEEYQMQQTWLNDQDKCTFIILSRELFEQGHDEIGTVLQTRTVSSAEHPSIFSLDDRWRESVLQRSRWSSLWWNRDHDCWTLRSTERLRHRNTADISSLR